MSTWMKRLRNLLLAFLLVFGAATAVTLTGCEDGPAEEAGEELDEAVDEIEDAAD